VENTTLGAMGLNRLFRVAITSSVLLHFKISLAPKAAKLFQSISEASSLG